jgi:hypothetical protein
MKHYTNTRNISLAWAVWLMRDTYDYDPDPGVISATTLLKSIRQIVLARKHKDLDELVDISMLDKSRAGTNIHDGAEAAWRDPQARTAGLKLMGFPDKVINKVTLDPTEEELKDGAIPLYLEVRTKKEVGIKDYKISGQFDMVLDGQVFDYKNTSVRSWNDPEKAKDYSLQGSIYRWLNPDKIDKDFIEINYRFEDWTPYGSKDQPSFRLMSKSFPLMTLSQTDKWIKDKISKIDHYMSKPDIELPECTPAELWQKETIYKVYKTFGAKTAMRGGSKFTSRMEAETFKATKGGAEIREIPGEATACRYCKVRTLCDQAQRLEDSGKLSPAA